MKAPSLRYRITMLPSGRDVYVYRPRGGWPRACDARAAMAEGFGATLCPIESEPVTIQDGRVAPGAP